MRHAPRLVAILAIAGLVAGCSDPCPQYHCSAHPSLVVVVTDADTGAPVADVRFTLATKDGQTTDFDGGTALEPWPIPSNESHSFVIGKVHVTVAADGYATTSFDVQIDEDRCGRAVGQRRDVGLQKLATARQAIVNEAEGPKQCGQE